MRGCRHGQSQGEERETGLEGGVAEHGLYEDRGEEDDADEDAGRAEHDASA